MRILGGKRKYALFLIVALFLGMQLLSIGVVQATEADATPHIGSIDPASGSAGDEVTITGTDFGSSQGSSTVAFGETVLPGDSVISWSNTEVQCIVPEGMASEVTVLVTTPGGVSNGVSYKVEDIAPTSVWFEIVSVTPSEAMQFSIAKLSIHTDVSLPKDYIFIVVLWAEEGNIKGGQGIGLADGSDIHTGYVFLIGPPGVYDVEVGLIYYGSGFKENCFTITPIPYCGAGSGSAVLMLGMTMGLLSLAGSGGILARRRKKKKGEV